MGSVWTQLLSYQQQSLHAVRQHQQRLSLLTDYTLVRERMNISGGREGRHTGGKKATHEADRSGGRLVEGG
jgi:hypothetical protein